MKKDLLEMKRKLLAAALAGTCMLGLTGCGNDSKNNNSETASYEYQKEPQEEKERKEQFLCIYPEKAVIIEPQAYYLLNEGIYRVDIDGDDLYDVNFSANQFIDFEKNAPLTAEEYVSLVCGPDFPIVYLENEENLTR